IYRCPSAGCAATPELVAADETAQGSFAFQGNYVFWQKVLQGDAGEASTDIRILRAPKNGSALPEQVLPPKEGTLSDQPGVGPYGLQFALDSHNVYWIDSSAHILSCPLEGCGDSIPTELVSSDDQKAELQVDDAGLYWTEANGVVPPGRESRALRFCAFARCAVGESIVLIDKPIYQYELNGQFIYWAEIPADDIGYPRTIERLAKPAP
ncbi:MAG TPA: hypothetical protein VNW92_15955, partial [Polyangiaceae bacterium]|nr:hypothetical protein [Polyangiaceae bacterium]